jgi:O-acetyl-ADP-ribose deacetylase (regulator of RNase III)/ADP-ribose pyrophosphatase YjhB (NUDIX family)
MQINNVSIKICEADITDLPVDAIVNAANNELRMGGGLALAIRNRGGAQIEAEAVALGPIPAGEAVVTGAGKLPARYVIHAATMGMDGKTGEELIRCACRNAFLRALELKVRSLALPALGCGVGRFPLVGCAKIMSQEILRVLRETRGGNSALKEIVLCLRGEEAFRIFEKQVQGYLRHVTQDLAWGPYVTADIIIEVEGGIVLVERSNPPWGLALPGGFVDFGESLETAAAREAREETGLELEDLRQFHTYSDPARDPRFHTVTTVFTARGIGIPKAGDDAAGVRVVPLTDLRQMKFAFDHDKVIGDYLGSRGL